MTAAPKSKSKFDIRLAETDEEREEIFRFRYDVYVGEMGKNFKDADHSTKMLTDKMDESASIYYVATPTGIACTIRINVLEGDHIPAFYHDAYDLNLFSDFPASCQTQTSRLMVSP
ncbi:MAG: hypothetical protein JKX97_07175, partial [Candidatus Lindowbacteria bacterium]|nr:hypothetical protein [Candidatus Lindowbacteria bacterium]